MHMYFGDWTYIATHPDHRTTADGAP